MTKKYPLFFPDDQFLSADSDIFKLLYDKSKNYVAINGDPFCNFMWETAYLRDEWLSLCSSLSSKFEKPLLVNASVSASSFGGA